VQVLSWICAMGVQIFLPLSILGAVMREPFPLQTLHLQLTPGRLMNPVGWAGAIRIPQACSESLSDTSWLASNKHLKSPRNGFRNPLSSIMPWNGACHSP